ncbi:MAG: HAMP domain-containing sensor histidine kinase [Thermodesulfobacteriota bacterium]|nr:MAG: HAMP domain-containing sensor histidine kinase [Thermodesulfobacteriota bacterium]
MKKFTLGIRSQLVAGIVVTTLAGIGLIGLLSIKIVENNAVYWKVSEAETIVRFIRAASSMDHSSTEPTVMIDYVKTALREARIEDFTLSGPSGRPVTSGGVLPQERGRQMSSSGDLKVWRIGGGFFSGPGEMLYVSAAVEAPGARPGRIEFTVPLDEINEDMASARRFLLLYALLDSIIIVGFGVFFLSRSITSPIKKLDRAAARIAGGALGERVRITVDNEIGSLANNFNIMADRIEDEIKSLERSNQELVNTQEELLRSSTLAVVGRLAAGIAHEVGNPLGAVRGYIDILSKGPLDKDEEKEILERAAREVTRIDLIVREFLDVARPSQKAPELVDVNRLVEESLSTLSVHGDFEGVAASVSLTEPLPPVLIDERKLRQVFINLLLNAAHSMEGKGGPGAVDIETAIEQREMASNRLRRRRDDPRFGSGFGGRAEKKSFVCIRFSDHGVGISEESAKQIFEPFYTTRGGGKGTGLGLFVSQSIIKTYGGEITLQTGPGEGSVFTVSLPVKEGHEDTDN